MNKSAKVILILSLFLGRANFSLAQGDTLHHQATTSTTAHNAGEPDDDMTIFLLAFVTIFFSAVFGAAAIGAFAATMILLFLFALIALGLLSTSLAIGLYRRSVSAGFKSLLVLIFTGSCSFIGLALALITGALFKITMSHFLLGAIGLTAGALGGILLALITFKVAKTAIKYALQKLKIALP